MARSGNAPTLLKVEEPPRDGEFFFEEGSWDEQCGCDSAARRMGLLQRHPFWSLGTAVAVGVVVASVLMKI